ncbi:MAG: thioredoxin family protein [Cyclobacteriaceae bacterium]
MKKSFKELINDEGIPVLVDFYATWRGPCQTMSPIIVEASNAFKGRLKVIKIDIDKNKAITAQLGIRSVPTFILFESGKMKWRKSGILTRRDLMNVLEKNC